MVRSDRTGTGSFLNEIRQAVWSVNRDVPIALERTMQDLYAQSLARTSLALVMLGVAGSMALALSIIGIYGVIATLPEVTVTSVSRIRAACPACGTVHHPLFPRAPAESTSYDDAGPGTFIAWPVLKAARTLPHEHL